MSLHHTHTSSFHVLILELFSSLCLIMYPGPPTLEGQDAMAPFPTIIFHSNDFHESTVPPRHGQFQTLYLENIYTNFPA